MTENVVKTRIASMIVDRYYEKLRLLACHNMEETVEYNSLIDKIKHCIKIENEEYHLLTADDLLLSLIDLENNKTIDSSLARHYSKLMYEMNLREDAISHEGVLLSDAITTKLLIDIIKNVENKIISYTNRDILDEEDIIMLNIYYKAHKFNYLTSNNYIESLALKRNFEVHKLPTMHFTDLENDFKVNFIDFTKPMIMKYASDAVDVFLNYEEEDRHAYEYSALFNLSRIECILNYLNIDDINKLLSYIDYNFNDGIPKDTVKSLIKKRKEGLK